MAAGNQAVSISQSFFLIFTGEGYEFWAIKMKTLFRSQELWDLVEHGFEDPNDDARLKDNRRKDSKALFFIQ